MTDADRKRAYVSDLYPGKGWKHKVSRMSDDQITAIYLRHQRDGKPPEHDEEEVTEKLDLEFEPEHLDIPHNGRGPHADEDQFPIY